VKKKKIICSLRQKPDLIRPSFLLRSGREGLRRLGVFSEGDGVEGLEEADEGVGGFVVSELLTDADSRTGIEGDKGEGISGLKFGSLGRRSRWARKHISDRTSHGERIEIGRTSSSQRSGSKIFASGPQCSSFRLALNCRPMSFKER
jgi:hypothetical protein